MKIPYEQFPEAFGQMFENIAFIKQHFLEKSTDPPPPADELWSIIQTAEFLNLTVSTIYGLVSRRDIPSMKKGKRLYFSKLQIIEWLKSGRKKTNAEISREAVDYLKKH